jgi:hypothetical protein
VGFDGDYFGSKGVVELFRSGQVMMSADRLHICLMRKSIRGSAFSSNLYVVSCSDCCPHPIFTIVTGEGIPVLSSSYFHYCHGGGDPRDPRDILPVWFHCGGQFDFVDNDLNYVGGGVYMSYLVFFR